MSIDHVTSSLQTALKGTGHSIFLPSGTDFTASLQLGHVLKGKVLRHYEGSRYLVDFNGQEKVVDSAVPLRTREIIHGRVIALGDRVELQRIHIDDANGTAGERTTISDDTKSGLPSLAKHERLIARLFDRYAARLPDEQFALLARLVKAATNPEAMATAGLILNKLGLQQSPEFLRIVYGFLIARESRHGLFTSSDYVLHLSVDPAGTHEQTKRMTEQWGTQMAALFDRFVRRMPQSSVSAQDARTITPPAQRDSAAHTVALTNDDEGKSYSEGMDHARWLLNAQTQGAVSHRVGTLPFWLGNQLIEVDVALFDQRPGTSLRHGVKHRQIVIALQLEKLGYLEVVARVAGDRLRLETLTSERATTEALSLQMGHLRQSLIDLGWQVDEMRYATRTTEMRSEVSRSVVEHIVSQDSLNRLM